MTVDELSVWLTQQTWYLDQIQHSEAYDLSRQIMLSFHEYGVGDLDENRLRNDLAQLATMGVDDLTSNTRAS